MIDNIFGYVALGIIIAAGVLIIHIGIKLFTKRGKSE